jgi:hypothetical protein
VNEGFCYVVFGEKAETEARLSIESLRMHNIQPVHAVREGEGDTDKRRSRWAKTNLDRLSPFDLTCYLDADTRPRADLSPGFQALRDGWEFVVSHSEHQDGDDFLWHVSFAERRATVDETGNPMPLVLQGGVFFFRKCEAVRALFRTWREEWARWGDEDQAALLRALYRRPMKIWMLGRPWNGGGLVGHRFGMCRA